MPQERGTNPGQQLVTARAPATHRSRELLNGAGLADPDTSSASADSHVRVMV